MSLHSDIFVDMCASYLMHVHGETTLRYSSLGQLQSNPVGVTNLSFCSISPEIRRWRSTDQGNYIYYERTGWAVIDPDHDYYCGVSDIQIGGRIVADGIEYTIEAATRQENKKITDFRVTRMDLHEIHPTDMRRW